MGYALVARLLIGVAVFAGEPVLAADRAASDRCDLAAASSQDPAKPPNVPGVAPGAIDPKVALPACEAALAADPANARLMFQLARAAHKAGDYERALRLNLAAARAGHMLAANNAAVQYEHGQGVPVDMSRALPLFRQAAEAGSPMAMRNVGFMLAHGKGTPRDDAQALTWFRRAAEAGNADAMMWTGFLTANGRGTTRDPEVAVGWYRRGADGGNADAMAALGLALERGEGTGRDLPQAASWYRRATQMGQVLAMRQLADMLRRRDVQPTSPMELRLLDMHSSRPPTPEKR